MDASISLRTIYVGGEAFELWSSPLPDFSCSPTEIRRYIDTERWDLVFNALCYLTGSVEEGCA
jgi:hypothetical protein